MREGRIRRLELDIKLTKVMRQKTCLMAVGKDLRGFLVSAAARPTNSVPAKEKAAVTRILQKPLKPLLNPPGSLQYRPPIYSFFAPPQLMIIPRMLIRVACQCSPLRSSMKRP